MSAEPSPQPGEWGIWHFPKLDELEDYFIKLTYEAIQSLENEDPEQHDDIDLYQPSKILVRDEWGDGRATPGEEGLDIILFFVVEGVREPNLDPDLNFDFTARAITQRMITLITDGEFLPPEIATDFFPRVDLEPASVDKYAENVMFALGTQEGNRVYDMVDERAIEFTEVATDDTIPFEERFAQLPKVPLDQLRREIEEEDVEEDIPEEVVEEEPTEEVEEEEPEEEDEEPEFETIPEPLRPHAVDETTLEVPVGSKDTKQVTPRDIYDFEIIMATDSPRPQFLEGTDFNAEADPAISGDVMSEIGKVIKAGRFDPNHPENTSPGTFPRTGVYIRNYLNFRGPAYVYQMFKDHIIYTQYVNGIWGYNLRPGTYASFRKYMYAIEEIYKRDIGPQLIRPLTQEESIDMNLDIVPDHPTIDGEKAEWLEPRQYYVIVEENRDAKYWENIHDYLGGRIEES